MNLVQLVWGVAAYLLSSLSLGLASWALAEVALPKPARLGLRLSAIFAGQLALCSILVQTLGIFGALTVSWYLAFSLAPGIAVFWRWRERRPLETFFRLFQQFFRLWIKAPAWGLGWLGALFLLYLAKRYFFLPRDIDALTLHGPMIVEWIQSGRVSLGSVWNYPQCWEYQFVPSFLLLRSEALVAIPSLLAVGAIVLAVRELAARLFLGGRVGHLLALVAATLPILWREPLKNDPVFAFALLLGMLALDRAARRLRGSFWLMQLAVFLVLGTKPSGFLYAGAFAGAWLALHWLRLRGEKFGARLRTLLPGLLFTLLFQASAGAVQLQNFFKNGNPVFPIQFELFGRVIFPGPGDLSGTSILDNLDHLEVWRQFLLSGSLLVGAEWPLLLLAAAAAPILALGPVRRRLAARERPRSKAILGLFLPLVALLLWGLFIATPWSCGLTRGAWQYLASGASLRYAIAPICLTYLVAAAVAQRFLGRRALFSLLALSFPLLAFVKWSYVGLVGGDGRFFLWKFFILWILVAGLDWGLSRWRLVARAGQKTKMVASFVLVLALGTVFARWVEGIREGAWAKLYPVAWIQVYQLPPASKIGTNDPMASYRYFLYGRGFENRMVVVDAARVESGRIPDDVACFYVFAKGQWQRQRLIDSLSERGWQVLATVDDRRGALLLRP